MMYIQEEVEKQNGTDVIYTEDISIEAVRREYMSKEHWIYYVNTII